MVITRAAVLGAVVALAGHGLAVGVTTAVAVRMGGGPDVDLDAGGRLAVLLVCGLTYGLAQLLVVGAGAVARWRLGPGALPGLLIGWIVGLGLSLFYLCGGTS